MQEKKVLNEGGILGDGGVTILMKTKNTKNEVVEIIGYSKEILNPGDIVTGQMKEGGHNEYHIIETSRYDAAGVWQNKEKAKKLGFKASVKTVFVKNGK